MLTLGALRAEIDHAVAGARPTELPELIGILEAAKVKATARALSPRRPPT